MNPLDTINRATGYGYGPGGTTGSGIITAPEFVTTPIDPTTGTQRPLADAPTPSSTDPYAQYGGQSRYNSLVSGFNNQKQALFDSSAAAGQQAGRDYNQGILQLVDTLKAGQTNIDRQATQNELSRMQGTRDVNASVGQGIRSGGVMLANRNAGDSSAAGALAAAYGQLGRQQLSQVGNQYEQGQNGINNSQVDLGLQQSAGVRDLGFSKEKLVNGIVTGAENSLAALDAAMANASLPDRINIQQEKERIRQETLGQLGQFDTLLQQGNSQGVYGMAPQSQDQRMAKANELANAGTAPDTAFNYTTQAPAQFQGTGPFASELPIFTFGRSRRTA